LQSIEKRDADEEELNEGKSAKKKFEQTFKRRVV
jgi:hypothetical protein